MLGSMMSEVVNFPIQTAFPVINTGELEGCDTHGFANVGREARAGPVEPYAIQTEPLIRL